MKKHLLLGSLMLLCLYTYAQISLEMNNTKVSIMKTNRIEIEKERSWSNEGSFAPKSSIELKDNALNQIVKLDRRLFSHLSMGKFKGDMRVGKTLTLDGKFILASR